MPTGEIRARFSVDTSGLSSAEMKMREFEKTIQGLFRRDPGRRAEFAISGAIQNLTSGNVVGAIESITSKMGGMGLIAGVALGAITAGIKKVIDINREWNKTLEATGETLASMPGAGASLEAMEQHLNRIVEAQSKLKPPALRIFPPDASWIPFRGARGESVEADPRAAEEARNRAIAMSLSEDYAEVIENEVARSKDLAAASNLMAQGRKAEADQLMRQIELGIKLQQIEGQARAEEKEVREAAKKVPDMPAEALSRQLSAIEERRSQQEMIAKAEAEMNRREQEMEKFRERARLSAKEMAPIAETAAEAAKRLEGQKLAPEAEAKLRERGLSKEEEQRERVRKLLALEAEKKVEGQLLSPAEEARLKRRGLSPEAEQKKRAEQLVAAEATEKRKELPGGAGLLGDRLLAQQAQRAEALGETFRKQGFVDLSAQQFKAADEFKSQMVGVKQAEKPELALKSAIDGAQIFQKMVTELEAIKKGVGDISFTNK